jgi:hypothetical protein
MPSPGSSREATRQTEPVSLTIDARFNGPPHSGNGGYVAGQLAEEVLAAHVQPTVGPSSPWVEVTLRTPPPLATPYAVELDDDATLVASVGETVVGTARVLESAPDAVVPVPAAQPDAVARAEQAYVGLENHPFPTCWVCGPQRPDGYHLRPGRIDDRHTACMWHVAADAAGTPAGPVPASAVWAALDCPGGWAALSSGQVVVLGRIAAAVRSVPVVGESCLVMGRLDAQDGRKVFTTTTVYRADGTPAASARSTWIAIDLP